MLTLFMILYITLYLVLVLLSLLCVCVCVALRPSTGHGLLILEVSRSHTTTHHSR